MTLLCIYFISLRRIFSDFINRYFISTTSFKVFCLNLQKLWEVSTPTNYCNCHCSTVCQISTIVIPSRARGCLVQNCLAVKAISLTFWVVKEFRQIGVFVCCFTPKTNFFALVQDRSTPPTPLESRLLTPSESLPNIRYGSKVTPVGFPYVSISIKYQRCDLRSLLLSKYFFHSDEKNSNPHCCCGSLIFVYHAEGQGLVSVEARFKVCAVWHQQQHRSYNVFIAIT